MILNDEELADDVRLLLKLFRAIGPRASEALQLPLDCLSYLESRGYALEYFMTKVDDWRRIPISNSLGKELAVQAENVASIYGPDCPWLFPYTKASPRGNTLMKGIRPKPISWSYSTFTSAVWEAYQRNGITGSSITGEVLTGAHLHRFRHTIATEMLANDWDTHEVKRFLGHKSATMVEAYAELSDDTMSKKYEEFVRTVTNPEKNLSDAEISSTARVEMLRDQMVRTSLPNGYCKLPDRLSCDVVPNPCLTCSFFVTTPVFLPVHIRQRNTTVQLLEGAKGEGRVRVAEGLEKKLSQLERIIEELQEVTPVTVELPSRA